MEHSRTSAPPEVGGSPGPSEDGGVDPYVYFQSARTQPKSLRRLLELAVAATRLAQSAGKALFWLVMGGQALGALLLGAQVLLGKIALASVLEQAQDANGSLGAAIPALVGLAFVTALAGLVTSALAQLQRSLGERVQQLTWRRIVDATTTVPLGDFESPEFFNDLERVKVNAAIRPLTMATGIVGIVGGALSVAGISVSIFVIAPALLPMLAAGAVPLWLLSRKTGKVEFAFAMAQTPQQRLRSYYEQVLTERAEAKEIRAFGIAGPITERWERSYAAYFRDLDRHVRRRLVLSMLAALVTAVATSTALAYLIHLAITGDVSLAAAGAAVIAIRLFAGRFQQLFGGIAQLFESGLFLEDLERFIARAAAAEREDDARTSEVPTLTDLELRDVSFRYPGSHRNALSNVDVRVGEGEVVALVGSNGSGKTTLAKLMAQLYEPSSGEVVWSGTPTSALDMRLLREQVGVIFQDFVRYQLTARDNIGLARHSALDDLERVVAAAKRGGIHEHLAALPFGYDTSLGKEFLGGYDLSGGQWQRVALARAFFRDARLLVLDEPTAALDARSEHEIFEYVRELAKGRSLVLISHRFSTVRSADRIYVLDGGRIVEQGHHNELMAAGRQYAEMFALQADAYR